MQNLDDSIIPRYRLLAQAGHRHGTKVFAQLCHPGFKPLPGIPIIEAAPSVDPPKPPTPHAPVPVERLHSLVEAFGKAAGRAAKGDVDGFRQRPRGGTPLRTPQQARRAYLPRA